MITLTKRIATAATVVLAASAPSAAYARFNLDPPAKAPVVSSQTVQNTAPPSARGSSASSSPGFQWDDAGVGAAGVLMLVGIGSGTVLARRRRTDHPLPS
jgi:hypothetical protein